MYCLDGSLWTLRDAPPIIPLHDLPPRSPTPEWDAPLSEAENAELCSLELFQSIDPSFLDRPLRKRGPVLPSPKPSKRRRRDDKQVSDGPTHNEVVTPIRTAPVVLVPASASPSAHTLSVPSQIDVIYASSVIPEVSPKESLVALDFRLFF